MDQFDTQIRIMQQSNAMQETIQDLYRWEKEMKQKENQSHQTAGTSEVSFTVLSAKINFRFRNFWILNIFPLPSLILSVTLFSSHLTVNFR